MPPTVVVTGRDEKVTARHKNHTEGKLAKLKKYFDGIVKVEAILGHTPAGGEAELVLSVRGGRRLVCRAEAKELYAAVDLVLDKAEAQLTRHKERLKSPKGRSRKGPLPEPGPPAGEEEEDYQDIVDRREF